MQVKEAARMGTETTTPKITPLVRQYSLTMDESTLGGPLPQALGLAVRKQEEEEREAEKQAHEWNMWLRFGETSR